jgi:hypothetical protein
MGANQEANVAEMQAIIPHKRRWLWWVAGAVLLVLAAAAGVVALVLHRAEPFLRARIVDALQERFHARVELDSFHVSLVNGLWAEGNGLRIWPPSQVEGVSVPAGQGEPLIRLAEFRFHAPLRYRPGAPVHVSQVELKGLSIHLPPRSHFEHAEANGAPSPGKPPLAAKLVNFQIDRMECTGAELVMEASKPGKLPLHIAIAHLKLTGISAAGPMNFDAELTNPRPVGAIHSTGSFGPLQGADLGEAPVQGEYRFDHADLASFKGIAGILSSTGRYQGTLRDLTVDGETDTPDFRLTHFGTAVALHTHFHAKVDGTNGDTWLQPVDATLGRSHFTAEGQVVRVPRPDAPGQSLGHDIALAVNVDRARIEDFLRLTSRSGKVLLSGDVALKTRLHIPPGAAPVHERLNLDGVFALQHAQFTSTKFQDRIQQLSLRGQGRPDEIKDADSADVRSEMKGSFRLSGGVVTLPALAYTVPGAVIQLKGTYGVEGGALDFTGTVKTDATVSKMVGGWKGMLLKPADRFFKKDGAGTEVPIHIQGTREDPKFGVDFGRIKSTSAERPGDAH